MSTIEGKIEQLKEIRDNIKTAINGKYSNNPAGNCMTTYAELIRNIPTGSGGGTETGAFVLKWKTPENPQGYNGHVYIKGTVDDVGFDSGGTVEGGALVVLATNDDVIGYDYKWVVNVLKEGSDSEYITIPYEKNGNKDYSIVFRMPNMNVNGEYSPHNHSIEGIICNYIRKQYSVSVQCIDTNRINITDLTNNVTVEFNEDTGVSGVYYYGTELKVTAPTLGSTKINQEQNDFDSWEVNNRKGTKVIKSGSTLNISYNIDSKKIPTYECVGLFSDLNDLGSNIGSLSNKDSKGFNENKVLRDCNDIYYHSSSERGYTILIENCYKIDVEGCKWYDIADIGYDINPTTLVKGFSDNYCIDHNGVSYDIYNIKIGAEPSKIEFKIKFNDSI